MPGTINLPNAKKLREGRTACPAKLIKFNGATCDWKTFRQPAAAEQPASTSNSSNKTSNERPDDITIDWAKVDQHAGWLKSVNDLPANFSPKGRMIVAHSGNLADLNFDLAQADLAPAKPYSTLERGLLRARRDLQERRPLAATSRSRPR